MSRPRDRHSALGLLPRMEVRPGKRVTSYRYRPADGSKPIPLGHDRLAAIRKVLDIEGAAPHHGTLRWVWESYRQAPRFTKRAAATRLDYEQCWEQIGPVLGSLPIAAITSTIVARYVRLEREDAPSRANHEKALLSNLFAHGIDLGACATNPAKEVRPNEQESRTEAPDPLVLARFLRWVDRQSAQRRIVGLAARFASLAGCRKVEFLDLAWPQVDGEVVRVRRAKQRGKKRGHVVDVIKITPALRACLDELRASRPPKSLSLAVFPQRNGNAYTERGFKTLWQRIIVAAMAEGVIDETDRFTFHDLRAYYATQHKIRTGKLPNLHKNQATTSGIYDRSTEAPRTALDDEIPSWVESPDARVSKPR